MFQGIFEKTLNDEEYINQNLYFENKTFLHGLFVIEDKISMAHGLEIEYHSWIMTLLILQCPAQ